MTLSIDPNLLDRVREHARSTYPEECIGILGGHDGDPRIVVDVRTVTNVAPENRRRRSLVAPIDVMSIDREYRKRGLKMVAFYHSHPDHPARPSDFDLEHALPWHTYVIIRVHDGAPAEITAWRLREDRSDFDSEPLLVQPSPDRAQTPGGTPCPSRS